jgi:hypothetical protein
MLKSLAKDRLQIDPMVVDILLEPGDSRYSRE